MNALVCTITLLLGCFVAAVPQDARDSIRNHPWDPGVVKLFATLPVQEDGRVKPLETQVSFLLLRMNGVRVVRVPDEPRFGAAAGSRLSPVEWALDALFYPELAAEYPVFQVQTSEVIHALGLAHDGKKKRDRYSFKELRAGEDQLMELVQRYSAIDEKERSTVQGQVVDLGINYYHYRLFTQSLAFCRLRFPLTEPSLRERFGGQDVVSLSAILARGAELDRVLRAQPGPDSVPSSERAALQQLRYDVVQLADEARFLAWLPPAEGETWLTLAQLVDRTLIAPRGGVDLSRQTAAVAGFERMALALDEPATFRLEAESQHALLSSLADERGEYDKVELEVALYEADPFYKSLLLYVLAFVLAAFSWLRPSSRWAWKAVGLAMAAGTIVLVAGIVVRCVLRSRPPISTLYETVLFVTATVTLTTMAIEWINRKRIAISLGALLGAAGMFLAASYERMDGQDTMPTLVAVLDTNFWLATHVTTVTMGYAAGLLAGGLAHVYLLGKLFRLRRNDKDAYRNLARMVYGVVCFGLLFSIVGTILGGVWANESWGRFWGWDPKENGALMIVLWNIVMLHARMGGFVRDFGLCLMAVFGNIVVAFSWWGVNLLGVGLHSYGFTAGVQRTLNGFYAVEAGMVLLGALAWMLQGRMLTSPAADKTPTSAGKGSDA
jgi:ABC-type transport system involved in cytochrome c biogenesis permease subunit